MGVCVKVGVGELKVWLRGVRVERRFEELRAIDGERVRERVGGDGGGEEEIVEI